MAPHPGSDQERAMTPSILRMVLFVATILGVGVMYNMFQRQAPAVVAQPAGLVPAPTQAVQSVRRTTKQDRANAAMRVRTAVNRELQSRGYLAPGAARPSAIATHAAILAFEDDHNLRLTATPNNSTLKALLFAQNVAGDKRHTAPATEIARKVIGEVQRALTHLGYRRGDITSQLDDATRTAIRKFERARGLQISGRVSAPLIASFGPAFDIKRLGHAAGQAEPNAG